MKTDFDDKVNGQWSSWSTFGKCSCHANQNIKGVKRATRQCNNPSPANGGQDCLGNREKFMICSASDDYYCENDLSATVEKICQSASLANPAILPFGDAQKTLDCQVQCFMAGPDGGSFSSGWFPDGTRCLDNDDHHVCIQGKCEKFTCHGQFMLENSKCQEDSRKQRQETQWTQWKVLTGCSHSCILPGNVGLHLVTRECLATGTTCSGLRNSVQLCQERSASSFKCQKMFSPDEYATNVCSNYGVSHFLKNGHTHSNLLIEMLLLI